MSTAIDTDVMAISAKILESKIEELEITIEIFAEDNRDTSALVATLNEYKTAYNVITKYWG